MMALALVMLAVFAYSCIYARNKEMLNKPSLDWKFVLFYSGFALSMIVFVIVLSEFLYGPLPLPQKSSEAVSGVAILMLAYFNAALYLAEFLHRALNRRS